MNWVIGGALAAFLVYAILELMVSSDLRESVYTRLPFAIMIILFIAAVAIGAAKERRKEIERLKGKKGKK